MNRVRALRARALHVEGEKLSEEGRTDEALAKYLEALELDFSRASTHYNIGLIHKYRNAWEESFRFNKRAVELDPVDEASNWNLAIAATALRDWKTAREVWTRLRIELDVGDGPIFGRFGRNPVRLNPEGNGEVVWAQRLCPVRARIENIPFPDSGFGFGDVVLHDGAPVGSRVDGNGHERDVFNVLELFEASTWSTFILRAEVAEPSGVEALRVQGEALEIMVEDWGQSVRTLCRACSEGRPHENHDHDLKAVPWEPERRMGVAGCSEEAFLKLVDAWVGPGRRVVGWDVGLER